jgi:hypothetical protein
MEYSRLEDKIQRLENKGDISLIAPLRDRMKDIETEMQRLNKREESIRFD